MADLALSPLFSGSGYGAEWEPRITAVLEAQPNAAKFIGPSRDARTVPVRELTFQALKPCPPAGWQLVSVGQSPYPRIESATGIAHFDNALRAWEDSQLGKCTTMRCIVKAAAMAKYGVPKETKVEALRALLRERRTVAPAEWFQAILAQGVLLINAALTMVPGEGKRADVGEHTKFWQPVVEAVVETILEARAERGQGVVFAWWGGESLKTKRALSKVFARHQGKVQIEHVEHKNPAAMYDAFCDEPNVFTTLNDALRRVGGTPVDWLPSEGWQAQLVQQHAAEEGGAPRKKKQKGGAGPSSAGGGEPPAGRTHSEIERMGAFISETQQLHQMYLERLRDGLDQRDDELADIGGIAALPLLSLAESCAGLGLEAAAGGVVEKAAKLACAPLSTDEAAAVYMYTTNYLYKQLNDALRARDRKQAARFLSYLRLFLHSLDKLPRAARSLYRGVGMDLSAAYKKGSEVTWWAVSSCTPSVAVASGFAASAKTRTLFHIKAVSSVSIRHLSAYQHEEEYILAPGRQFRVADSTRKAGLVEIFLEELDRPSRVH